MLFFKKNGDLPSFLSNPPAASTEVNGESCPFFSKTGMCRFGSVCSRWLNVNLIYLIILYILSLQKISLHFFLRHHQYPSVSDTIVIPNFYNHFGLGKALRDEFNSDMFLEYEDKEIYHHFWSVHFIYVHSFLQMNRSIISNALF